MQQMTGVHYLSASNAQPFNNQPQAFALSAFNQQQSVPPTMPYYCRNSYGSFNVGGHINTPNNMSNAPDMLSTLVVDVATPLMMNDLNLPLRQALEMAMQKQQRQMQQMTSFHNLSVSNAQPFND
jgi:hypothetical protein